MISIFRFYSNKCTFLLSISLFLYARIVFIEEKYFNLTLHVMFVNLKHSNHNAVQDT